MISFYIKVKASASKDEISIDPEGNWVVRIKEKPVDGAANIYLVKFIAKKLGVAKSNIIIEKGQNSPFKRISINMDEAEFQNCLKGFK